MDAGGLTMVELVSAMKKDALEQDKIVAMVADLIEKIVNRNDKMQVSRIGMTGFCF
jgi:dienelactone hydrolase